MKKMKRFFKITKIGVRDLLYKDSVQLVIIIVVFLLSAIISGIAAYRVNAPTQFSGEELSLFEVVSESIYSDGIDDTNMSIRYLYNNFEDVEISIPSESQIEISLDDGKRYVIADFSIPSNPEIIDHYSHELQIFLAIVGAIVGGIAVLAILYAVLAIAEGIIKLKAWFNNMSFKTDEELLTLSKPSDDDDGCFDEGDDDDDDGCFDEGDDNDDSKK